MIKIIKKLFIILLLLTFGCVSTRTIDRSEFLPLSKGKPLSEEALLHIHESNPKDAVFADINQAFALMRGKEIDDEKNRRVIYDLLARSVITFEDLTDPVNFSEAFSADEDKPFRGLPHERVATSVTAGIFAMADGRCDLALPYFRNAEFLDARFQKMPFGTDAPLVYALSLRCLHEISAPADELKRASDGIFKSVRFLSIQEALIELLVSVREADLRAMAISNRMAYMLFEIGIYHALLSSPGDREPLGIIDDAAYAAELFVSSLTSNFLDEFNAKIEPVIHVASRVYGMNSDVGRKHLKELAFLAMPKEIALIKERMKLLMRKDVHLSRTLDLSALETEEIFKKIVHASLSSKMVLTFSGIGPKLTRKGNYQEIAMIEKSADANPGVKIRQEKIKTPTSCGFHRLGAEDFSIVLCKDGRKDKSKDTANLNSLELLSLSRKATSVQGRKFESILKGRARFRAATEQVAEISAWSALFLFYMGTAIIDECHRRRAPESCYAAGLALYGIAGATIIFSGTIWLIGKTSNPAADSRFIHLMYESVWVSSI